MASCCCWTGAPATTRGQNICKQPQPPSPGVESDSARQRQGGTASTPEISLPDLRRPHEGLPDRTGHLPSNEPAKGPPGHPLIASQRGQQSGAGPPTACHHTGQLSVRRGPSPTLGAQDCPSEHGQLPLQKAQGQVRESTDGHSGDSCFCYPVSFLASPGQGVPLDLWGTTLLQFSAHVFQRARFPHWLQRSIT